MRGHQDDRWLKLSHDRKVSPRGLWQASRKRWVATIPNSFGLPAGASCPGATDFCVSCYAAHLEPGWPGVAELVDHNLMLLEQAGTVESMAALLAEAVGRYRTEAQRRGLTDAERIFRIHWDGDFYSLDYARAWRAVITTSPDIRFWTYTRSFVDPVDVIPILAGIDNLALYLSADPHNIDQALERVGEHPDVLLALCDVDYSSARALAPDRPHLVCPENAERIPLMAGGVGACVSCRLCPDAKRDVLFSTSHREHETDQLELITVPIEIRLKAPTPGVRTCRLATCDAVIAPTGKPGRPRLYCSPEHRLADRLVGAR